MINRYPPERLAEDFLTHEKYFSLKKSIKVSFLHQILSYQANKQHITQMILFVSFYIKYHRSITKVS